MANTYNVCNKLQAIADAITQGGGGGGGTTVIANPTGTPTADLDTVQIGQVIYDIPRGGGSDQAVDINYDNTTSGLTATNVQDAIDENADSISTLNSNFSNKLKYVSGTCVNGFSSYCAFPTGYDYSNCIIMSVMVDESGTGTVWRAGAGSASASSRLFAEMSSDGVRVYNDFSGYAGRTFYVALMLK